MAFVFLFGSMLIVMLVRVAAPLGVRIDGQPVGRISLGWRERVRLQRTNVYAIGAVLLLASATSNLPLIGVLVVIVGILGILAIPTRYVLTTRGVALNRTVFRSWTDFSGFEIDPKGIRLVPKPGVRGFRLVMSPPKSQEVARTLQRFLAVVPRTGSDATRRSKLRGRWPTRTSRRSRTMASAHP
jgi:hypothetical protein